MGEREREGLELNDGGLLLFNKLVSGGILEHSHMAELHELQALQNPSDVDVSLSINPDYVVCLL